MNDRKNHDKRACHLTPERYKVGVRTTDRDKGGETPMADPQVARVAGNVRAAMDRANITAAELAERVGRLRGRRVSPMWVSRRTLGDVPLVRPAMTTDLADIARALGMTVEELTATNDEPAASKATGRRDRADNQPGKEPAQS
jgi:transcriptional regulator with XRE-family HTH domain